MLIYETNKSIYGVIEINGCNFFYKKLKVNYQDEITGYDIVSKSYNVPKRINTKDNEIIYEYKEELINNTLHEYIYLDNTDKVDFDVITKQIKKNYLNRVIINENECKNICFFKNRVSILEKYKIDELFKRDYYYKGQKYNPSKILDEIIEILCKDKMLTSFITPGDPTDTNISVNGLFTDFENGGYNSVIGEIAISFASFITHGCYFYPKYHKDAYLIRPYILNNYLKYEPKYYNGEIVFSCNKKAYEVFKNFLNIYIELDKEEVNKYLKYYICMRMLTPIDLLKMEDKDKLYIISYLIFIYHNISSINDIIKFMEVMYEF